MRKINKIVLLITQRFEFAINIYYVLKCFKIRLELLGIFRIHILGGKYFFLL